MGFSAHAQQVHCFGHNREFYHSAVPKNLPPLKQISIYGNQTCGLTTENTIEKGQRIICWGEDISKVSTFGNINYYESVLNPELSPAMPSGSILQFKLYSRNSALILTSDGQLYSFGIANHEFNYVREIHRWAATTVPLKSFVASQNFVCGHQVDGLVVCTGGNVTRMYDTVTKIYPRLIDGTERAISVTGDGDEILMALNTGELKSVNLTSTPVNSMVAVAPPMTRAVYKIGSILSYLGWDHVLRTPSTILATNVKKIVTGDDGLSSVAIALDDRGKIHYLRGDDQITLSIYNQMKANRSKIIDVDTGPGRVCVLHAIPTSHTETEKFIAAAHDLRKTIKNDSDLKALVKAVAKDPSNLEAKKNAVKKLKKYFQNFDVEVNNYTSISGWSAGLMSKFEIDHFVPGSQNEINFIYGVGPAVGAYFGAGFFVCLKNGTVQRHQWELQTSIYFLGGVSVGILNDYKEGVCFSYIAGAGIHVGVVFFHDGVNQWIKNHVSKVRGHNKISAKKIR